MCIFALENKYYKTLRMETSKMKTDGEWRCLLVRDFLILYGLV